MPLTSDENGGYAGTFVVGVSGLPEATATGAIVQAGLTALRFRRSPSGRRLLRTTLGVKETVTVDARLTRAGRTLVHQQIKGVTAGTRTLDLRIPQTVARGSARLSLTFTDAGGASRTVHRTVTVPRKAV